MGIEGIDNLKPGTEPNRFQDANDEQELLYMLAGAASMCWENVRGAGVFDSTEAKKLSEEAYGRLQELKEKT